MRPAPVAPLLRLEAVGKAHNARAVLRGVTLDVAPGTLTLVTGPNGSGKSTLLRIMAGLSRPDNGSVTYYGPPGSIGYLGHETLLYPQLTAMENLEFWARLHGLPPDGDAPFDALDRMGLDAHADERAGVFSRGMAQRLSLARLFLLSPSLILLDEPLTGLDASSAARLRDLAPALKARGAALVWVTHDPDADAAHADAVLTIKGDGVLARREKTPLTRTVPRREGEGEHSSGAETRETSLLHCAVAIAAKDIRLLAGRGGSLVQALLLGLLLIVLFGLGLEGGVDARPGPAAAAAVFWLASAFCLTILVTALFGLEETNKARLGLLLSPAPRQAVWLGKTLAGCALLLLVQTVFLAASVVFLGQSWIGPVPLALAAVPLVDMGIVGLSTLMGSLARGQAARESLCSLVVFPLLVPALLAGIRVLSALYAPEHAADAARWLGFAASFGTVFAAAALVLFPFLYGGDD